MNCKRLWHRPWQVASGKWQTMAVGSGKKGVGVRLHGIIDHAECKIKLKAYIGRLQQSSSIMHSEYVWVSVGVVVNASAGVSVHRYRGRRGKSKIYENAKAFLRFTPGKLVQSSRRCSCCGATNFNMNSNSSSSSGNSSSSRQKAKLAAAMPTKPSWKTTNMNCGLNIELWIFAWPGKLAEHLSSARAEILIKSIKHYVIIMFKPKLVRRDEYTPLNSE